MSALDFIRHLRLLLEASSDAPPLPTLIEQVDAFVLHCSVSPDADTLIAQLEDDLQRIHHALIVHAVLFQTEIFLLVLFHLRPLLPPSSLISTWFELVLRPALREPKLSTSAVNHAKELILSALDPVPSAVDASDEHERNKRREKVGNFRRRLMDLYLLDAYNESSGDDVLELAELDDVQREKKACWKSNLEDVLVRVGLQRPNDLLTEIYNCFSSPTTRLQLLMLLHAFTSQRDFPTRAAVVMAQHPLTQSLLHSLVLDNSSTIVSVGITMLAKCLPIFAVYACEDLKRILPWLFVILARIICWKIRKISNVVDPQDGTKLGLDPDVLRDMFEDEEEELDSILDNRNTLPIRSDLDWTRLDVVFSGINATNPPPHQFFSFLYYLFPCNSLRFLRYPVSYLTDNNLETPYSVSWEEALDEGLIRSKSEPLLRGHVLHPLLIWRDATAELVKPDFWADYDIPRIVGECTMLDVRNASLGLREAQQVLATMTAPVHLTTSTDEDSGPDVALSSSAGSSGSSVLARMPVVHPVSKPRISLQDMVTTSIALKSGLDIELVDTVSSSSWASEMFQQTRTRSPSRDMAATTSSRTVTPDTSARPSKSTDEIPSHVAQAIAELQREVLLLRSELNFELWSARENVVHIGRLYQDKVVSKNSEIERQGLHNKMREYKAEVHRLQRELNNHKEQASAMSKQYGDWNRKLQDKVREMRAEKASWLAEATAMRAADKEAKETFMAQGILLAEASGRVFHLETKIKENAHKVDRLHDYERLIEQLIKMQRLWESDTRRLNDQDEYLKAFTSRYHKMGLRLESYEKTHAQMDDEARRQRQQVQSLQARLLDTQKQLLVRKRSQTVDFSQYNEHAQHLSETNRRLKDENEELKEEIVDMKGMMEMLKAQVMGNKLSFASPVTGSPLIPARSFSS